MSEKSDRELLIISIQQQQQLKELLANAMKQLERGNARFEQIALKTQEQDSRITGLATEHSRLMATMDKQVETITSLAETAKAALRLAGAVQQQSEKAHRALFDDKGVIDRLEHIEEVGSPTARKALALAREVADKVETYKAQITALLFAGGGILTAFELYMNYFR